MEKEYADHVAELARTDADLADLARDWQGIDAVLTWMQRSGTGGKIDLIGQDEFEYDFLIELTPTTRWLALGVT